MDLKTFIRDIPDFPKKGILFKDITPLLGNSEAFRFCIDQFVRENHEKKIDLVVGPESRGFIFATALAYALKAGFAPIRKPGKLPYQSIRAEYQLEYGTDSVQMHVDAVKKGQRVLVIDDLLATGGTAAACCDLVKQLGGEIVGIQFLIELAFLKGREKIEKFGPTRALVVF